MKDQLEPPHNELVEIYEDPVMLFMLYSLIIMFGTTALMLLLILVIVVFL